MALQEDVFVFRWTDSSLQGFYKAPPGSGQSLCVKRFDAKERIDQSGPRLAAFSTSFIKQGDTIFALPLQRTLSMETAKLWCPAWTKKLLECVGGLDEMTILQLFLIHFVNSGCKLEFDEHSCWEQGLATVIRYLWRRFISVDVASLHNQELEQELEGLFQDLFPALSLAEPSSFPQNIFTYRNFLRAAALVNEWNVVHGLMECYLLPLNCSNGGLVRTHSVSPVHVSITEGRLQVVSFLDIQPGDEVVF